MNRQANSQVLTADGLKPRLVAVAAELLSESKAIKLPTMREISVSAGVSVGAAYRHFESQEDLFFAVVTSLFDDLELQIKDAAASARNSRDALGAMATAYVMWGLNNPGGYQLLFETTDDPKLLERGLRPGLHLIEQFASSLSSKSKSSEKSQLRVLSIWASLHGLVSLRNHKLGMQWPNTPEAEVRSILGKHILR
jgi:AcrR family transcriptional regulator